MTRRENRGPALTARRRAGVRQTRLSDWDAISAARIGKTSGEGMRATGPAGGVDSSAWVRAREGLPLLAIRARRHRMETQSSTRSPPSCRPKNGASLIRKSGKYVFRLEIRSALGVGKV